jgi:glycosyltransferase involved in cell wall biosynthesis
MSDARRWVLVSIGHPEDRWAWSGVPESIARALRARGEDVLRVSCDLPAFAELNLARIARRLPGGACDGRDVAGVAAVRTALLAGRRVGWAGSRVIAFGSTFRTPYVDGTFEDMTVAQTGLPASSARERWRRRQASIYAAAARCFAATEWAAGSIRTDYGQPPEKVVVTGFGPNIVCRPVPKDWSSPRFLWVGSDWHRKGGDVLLSAFGRAAIPGATLDLVGAHPRIDLPGVTGHGAVRESGRLAALFEAATLFVLPSRFDAAPIVCLEAATAGTPIIATDTGGTAEHVGGAGETIAPADVGALVAAMRRMSSPSVAERHREAAIARAATQTWDRVAGRMIEAFRLT